MVGTCSANCVQCLFDDEVLFEIKPVSFSFCTLNYANTTVYSKKFLRKNQNSRGYHIRLKIETIRMYWNSYIYRQTFANIVTYIVSYFEAENIFPKSLKQFSHFLMIQTDQKV